MTSTISAINEGEFHAEIGETVVYPPCQRSPMEGQPHNFRDVEDHRSGTPFLYCANCGLVQKVEVL